MLGAVVAAIMAASFFMPWIRFFGEAMGPMTLFQEPRPELADLSWQMLAFLASFAIAALAAVLAVMQRAAGFAMLVAGAIPFGLMAHSMWRASDRLGGINMPFIPEGTDPMNVLDGLRRVMDIGLPAYIVAAALLVVMGAVRMVRGA